MEADDAAVEERARDIFRRERRHYSVTWDVGLGGKPPLGDRAREEYRARARQELMELEKPAGR